MNSINYYRNILIERYTAKNPNYNPDRDSGLNGKALELAVKDYLGKKLTVSPQGCSDLRIGSRNVDVKCGASDLGEAHKTLIKGSGLVAYVPVPQLDYDITMQEGYVLDRGDFLEALNIAGALRPEKTMSDGSKHTCMQTFWNRTQNKPHGRLLDRMLTQFDEFNACDMVDYIRPYAK